MKYSISLIGLLFISGNSFSQVRPPDTTNFIEYLNLSGNFTHNGQLWIDEQGVQFGIKDDRGCAVHYSFYIGQTAYAFNLPIAEYRAEQKHVCLYYDNEVIYVKLKKVTLWDFLIQNTLNGQLVEPDLLRIDGKKIRTYCHMNRRSYKLSNNCN
ncbi:MAG: hypothetical protein QNK23_11945 [Crocinitomicaceae bacterium]|nr:hypothetical protein [Crocinitomicaceae bacterium]